MLKLIALLAVLFMTAHLQVRQKATACPSSISARAGSVWHRPQWMRKNHMKVLFKQRDETVHQGIRDGKYSLKNCVECHASLRDNSVIGRPDSFCEGCHRYEAVKIDCFECHSSKRSTALAQEES